MYLQQGGQGKNGPSGGVFENAESVIKDLNNAGRNVFVLANMGAW